MMKPMQVHLDVPEDDIDGLNTEFERLSTGECVVTITAHGAPLHRFVAANDTQARIRVARLLAQTLEDAEP